MTISVLIMAGGTGGHVFPALALADALQTRSAKVNWIGTERGIESRLVPAAGLPLHLIHIKGLRGNGALGWLLAPFNLLKAIMEAIFIIKRVAPDVVIGLGGFASGPGGLAAWLMRKPLLIHEQNAIAGLTNKLLAKLAKQVLTGFNSGFTHLNKAKWIGNPVRNSIENIAAPEQRLANRTEPLKLLVLGGSLGARTLNQVAPAALQQITQPAIEVKHQCGKRHLADCQQHYQDAGIDAEVIAFIDDMATVYQWADLVICRAGALTIAELAATGVASILVPYPYAVDDHQTHNAQALVDAGAAIIMQETDLSAQRLADALSRCFASRQRLIDMASAARTQAKTGVAETLAEICFELIGESNHG